jgi:pyrroline-5-carboxylate reductase
MKTGFIGAGKMAEAIIASLLRSKTLRTSDLFASDVDAARRRLMKQRYAINVYSKNRLVVSAAEVLFLAVKPQNLDAVLRELAPDLTEKHLVVSIAAGRTIAGMESLLPRTKVVRVMPNLPCVVAEGMSVFCMGSRTEAGDRRTALKLLSCFGKVLELPESRFDAVTALSGSGPAFFAYVLSELVEGGVQQGLDRDAALLMAEQTMLGTSRLLMDSKLDPQDLIRSVASAKGTTAAGLAVIEKSALARTLHRTIKAAARRSKELSAGE